MDSVLALINEYGMVIYAILFSYCALKSGWLPLFAGYAAYAGALDVSIVAIATFAGGYLGDELRFIAARKYGVQWLERPTRLGYLFQRAKTLADRHAVRYIFIYRYPKGLRTIGALPIGLTDMNWSRFTFLNASSALLWTFVLVGGGYSFGSTFETLGMQNLTAVSLMLLGIFLFTLYRAWLKEDHHAIKIAEDNKPG
ncbi:MAG: DedA family protein [Enterobacterales bacterium]|nr:DedA family protein [Enterobacterales bacterium]